MAGYDAEVIVVGGGPAGATTASLLASRSHDVLLLDRARFPREKPCAEYLSPGVEDVLRRLGAWEAVAAQAHTRPRGMQIITNTSNFMLTYPDGRCSRAALGIDRPTFDNVLLNYARDSGACVRESTPVVGAVVDAGRVLGVRARTPEGERELRAHFVVAADGRHSAISRSLGLEAHTRAPRRLGLVARYEAARAMASAGEMHVAADSYCGLAPLGGDLVNVGLVVPLRAKPGAEPIGSFFERWLGKLPGVAAVLEGARRVTPVRGIGPLARVVRRTAGSGYLLVGDAAGFLDPFTGEGVYRALRGAELAADAVEDALSDPQLTPRGYERARRGEFGAKERVCRLVQLFLRHNRLFETIVGHLAARPALAAQLGAVLGDYRPAQEALRPAFLWSLLRP